jgi:hypothetical protein
MYEGINSSVSWYKSKCAQLMIFKTFNLLDMCYMSNKYVPRITNEEYFVYFEHIFQQKESK